MKIYILSILLFSNIALAGKLTCNLNATSPRETKSETITHEFSYHGGATHSRTEIKILNFDGFLSFSKGYAIVFARDLETGQSFSAYGNIMNGNSIGGNFYTVNPETTLQYNCGM